MLWAACCLGFFGFLRAGEFMVTPWSNPQVLEVHIRYSKTDPYGAGSPYSAGPDRRHLVSHCSCVAIPRHSPPSRGPLFIFQDGSPLTRAKLVLQMRQALAQAGIDTSKYAGHSFRIGAATTAARAGLHDSLIQTLGRWQSSAFMSYIRTPAEDLISVSSKLAKPS